MQAMPIHELMTRNVPQGSPGMSLSEVIRLLHDQRLSCLVIVEAGTPVGIITERDLVRTLARIAAGEKALDQVIRLAGGLTAAAYPGKVRIIPTSVAVVEMIRRFHVGDARILLVNIH